MKNKNLLIIGLTIIVGAIIYGCADWLDDTDEYKNPETEMEDISYIIGSDFAKQLQAQGLLDSININVVAKSFLDVREGTDLAISEKQANQIMENYGEKLAKKAEQRSVLAQQAADAYMSDTIKKGIITTESGLQYQILKQGNGEKQPVTGDLLTMEYTGMLTDGNIFDSSFKGSNPFKTSLEKGGTIAGFEEALRLMRVGDKWRIIIPGDLAYGERGIPQAGIGPNATLIFEIELLAIN